MSGANIKDILSLLPLRIRQQDKEFKTAAMDVEERKKQYLKIKGWISDILEQLAFSGTSQHESPSTEITMVTINGSEQVKSNQHNNNTNQGRGNKQQRQDSKI